MANNRLYAVCKICNQFKGILKYYPSNSWYMHNEHSGIEKWFEEHMHEEDKTSRLWGDHIEFVTEINDDKVELYDFENKKIYLKKENNGDPVQD